MKKRRAAALIMGMVMVASTIPAAASEGDVVTLTYFNADGKEEDPWSNPVAQAITDATGVAIELSFPVTTDAESIALMIADDTYPDLIFAKGNAGDLYEAGAYIDMEPLIDEYGPNIKKMFGDEYEKLRWSADDPGIYQLSYYELGHGALTTSGPAQIQYAVLKENDWKYPTTIAEYEEMIKAYLEAHPTTEDGYDMIGLTLVASDWRWMITLGNPAGFIADAQPDNGQWLIDENYNCIYKHTTEAEKEYFQWLCRMYNEGILDPDFATQTYEDYIAKLSTGRVVGILDALWDYQEAQTILVGDGKIEQTFAGVPVTLRDDQLCPSLQYQGMGVGWGVGISKDCADPVAAVKFLDFICSDEGQVLLHWGVEGTNYEVDENGNRYRTEEEIAYQKTDADYAKDTGVGYYVGNGWPHYSNGVLDPEGQPYTTVTVDSLVAEYNSIEKEAVEAWDVTLLADIFPQADQFDALPYAPLWAYQTPSDLSTLQDVLDNEISWPGLVKCVRGTEDEFEANWQALQDDLVANGVEDLEAGMTEFLAEKIAAVQ